MLPLYPGTLPLETKIAAAEALYRARGQAVVFKLTALSQPPDLDARLEALGYRLDAPTSGQVLDLTTAALAAPNVTTRYDPLDAQWLDAVCALSRVDPRHRPTMEQMLAALVPTHAFFCVWDGPARLAGPPHPPPHLEANETAPALENHHPHTSSEAQTPTHLTIPEAQRSGTPTALACGLAVLQDGHVGLADIVTHPAHRRQGHARRLILDALAWACSHGAHTAYLQVMLDNAPALALYAELGFMEVYRYWYRVKG